MRHRLLLALTVLVGAFLLFLSPSTPLQAIGAYTLMFIGAAIAFGLLLVVTMFLRALIFEHATPRWRRFN